MPIFLNNRLKAVALKNKHYLLNIHILEYYNKLSKQKSIYPFIKKHKPFISQFKILSKKNP